jgi:hypothetical protein
LPQVEWIRGAWGSIHFTPGTSVEQGKRTGIQ